MPRARVGKGAGRWRTLRRHRRSRGKAGEVQGSDDCGGIGLCLRPHGCGRPGCKSLATCNEVPSENDACGQTAACTGAWDKAVLAAMLVSLES